MAFFPCSVGPHAHRSPNHLCYVAVGSGADFRRHRVRLCPSHWARVDDYLAKFEAPTVDDTGSWPGVGSDCIACGEPTFEPRWQVFITAYPAKDERKDYWSYLHVDCQLPKELVDPDLSRRGGDENVYVQSRSGHS